MAEKSNKERIKQTREDVRWGRETARVFKSIGKVTLRVLSYLSNIILTLVLIGMVTAVIVGTAFALYIKNNLDLSIDADSFITSSLDKTTSLYYMKYETQEDRYNRDGVPVELESQSLYGTKNSVWVPYTDIPKTLIDAFVSVEDHRFFSHNGVDWIGTSKAMVNFFVGFDSVRGASTITQQLVKNLTGEDDVRIPVHNLLNRKMAVHLYRRILCHIVSAGHLHKIMGIGIARESHKTFIGTGVIDFRAFVLGNFRRALSDIGNFTVIIVKPLFCVFKRRAAESVGNGLYFNFLIPDESLKVAVGESPGELYDD